MSKPVEPAGSQRNRRQRTAPDDTRRETISSRPWRTVPGDSGRQREAAFTQTRSRRPGDCLTHERVRLKLYRYGDAYSGKACAGILREPRPVVPRSTSRKRVRPSLGRDRSSMALCDHLSDICHAQPDMAEASSRVGFRTVHLVHFVGPVCHRYVRGHPIRRPTTCPSRLGIRGSINGTRRERDGSPVACSTPLLRPP